MPAPAVYYNEHDPFCCAWLRELITVRELPDGEIDDRDIWDVHPDDLRGFQQCHFFAGIGGWAYALRLAGWPDDRAVWTGSCPCQPFSAAGKGAGFTDARHLWPAWEWLIRQHRPPVIFGEQVDNARAWLDLVCTDLEKSQYAVGAVDLPACSVGAFHKRQRLFFVADASGERCTREPIQLFAGTARQTVPETFWHCEACGKLIEPHGRTRLSAYGCYPVCWGHCACQLGDSSRKRLAQQRGERGASRGQAETDEGKATIGTSAPTRAVAYADDRESRHGAIQRGWQHRQRAQDRTVSWKEADWLLCTDGKARAVEPGTFPLAHGLPARVGRLRGYGNAIVPQVAEAVVRAYLDDTTGA